MTDNMPDPSTQQCCNNTDENDDESGEELDIDSFSGTPTQLMVATSNTSLLDEEFGISCR